MLEVTWTITGTEMEPDGSTIDQCGTAGQQQIRMECNNHG